MFFSFIMYSKILTSLLRMFKLRIHFLSVAGICSSNPVTPKEDFRTWMDGIQEKSINNEA